jgi:hypothetical protein
MRPHALLLLLPALFAGPLDPCCAERETAAPLQATCAGTATEGPDVEAVRRMELRGARMNVDGWGIEGSRDFFAPDFVSIGPDGAVNGLEAIMSAFTNGRSPGWARSFDLASLDIRVFDCSTGVVVGTAEARALNAPAEGPLWRVRFLNVWRKEGGRWLYWANQFAPITPDSEQAQAQPANH